QPLAAAFFRPVTAADHRFKVRAEKGSPRTDHRSCAARPCLPSTKPGPGLGDNRPPTGRPKTTANTFPEGIGFPPTTTAWEAGSYPPWRVFLPKPAKLSLL